MRASDPAMAATPKSTLTAPKNRDSLEGEATRVVIGDVVFQVNDAVRLTPFTVMDPFSMVMCSDLGLY